MHVHSQFIGGNIRVLDINNDVVTLENEQRGSMQDWFYWAFCVEGAGGETVTFRFNQPNRVGYYGAAVSHDLKTWHWLDNVDGEGFCYTFAEGEDRVYFAHDFLYHPDRFDAFCKAHNLKTDVLCQSQKGRPIPCLHIGEGERVMLLTARHHACEATGSYVLEGLLDAYLKHPVDGVRILVVPFVDYDGVVDGDQGKSRAPHDPNRDYGDEPALYPAVNAIRQYVGENGCHYAFDFHSPWHKGDQNDLVYIVESSEKHDLYTTFGDLLEVHLTEGALQYKTTNNYPINFGWNKPCPCFTYVMQNTRPECVLAFSLETPYFGEPDKNKVSEAGMLALGESFYGALCRYLEETKPLCKTPC